MSKIITKIRKIWQRLADKEYRDAYISAHLADSLAGQIYSLREKRGWTQGELAQRADMAQPRISKLEESCDGVSVTTLKKIASAFDVGLSIEFVTYSRIVASATCERLDRNIASFEGDSAPYDKASEFNIDIKAVTAISFASTDTEYDSLNWIYLPSNSNQQKMLSVTQITPSGDGCYAH